MTTAGRLTPSQQHLSYCRIEKKVSRNQVTQPRKTEQQLELVVQHMSKSSNGSWDGSSWFSQTLVICAVAFPLADPLLHTAWEPVTMVSIYVSLSAMEAPLTLILMVKGPGYGLGIRPWVPPALHPL